MRRRDLLTIMGCSVAASFRASAQPTGRPRKIGVLIGSFEQSDSNAKAELNAFGEALAAAGWREGNNLEVVYRWGGGNIKRIEAAAAELTKMDVDLIVARSTPSTAAILRHTTTIPVIFVQLADPVSQGFVQSFAKPGTNVTAFTNLEASLASKWLALLKELLPPLDHVPMIYNAETSVDAGRLFIAALEAAAPTSGVTVKAARVGTPQEIEAAIQELNGRPSSALVTTPGSYLASQHHTVIRLTATHRVPAFYPFTYWVHDGGLMSYGIDSADLFRRAASYVDRILRGTRVTELPVQAPTKFEMVLNLKTAKMLGIQIPPMLLARADEVIE
jgi:putative tryptophan/tyrosine transport system substrate-binding protein